MSAILCRELILISKTAPDTNIVSIFIFLLCIYIYIYVNKKQWM